MSQLTESQRLRAEQNRLKALQIRQQKLAALGGSVIPQSNQVHQQLTSGTSHPAPPAPPAPPSTTGHPKFTPPSSNPTSVPSVSTSTVRPSGFGATNFYSPPSSVSSGAIHTSSTNIKTTSGNCQPGFRPEGGVSGPPIKYPRIEAPSKTTSTFPPDVLKRIEENKRKARERQEAVRKAREQGLTAPPMPAAILSSRQPPQPPRQFPQPPRQPPQPPRQFPQPPRQFPQPPRQPVHPSTNDRMHAPNQAAPKPSKVVTLSFTLISVSTFKVVTSMFHAATIQVFKTMTSRSYDYKTRIWSFKVNEHQKLVAALRPLQPEVEIQSLPQFVLKALESVEKKVPAEYIDLFGLDTRLQDALMPFQVEGVKFGISLGGRVLLADDMGLGKTIQALGIACHYRSEWPLLVVAPSSMRYSWEESILRWVSSVNGEDVRVMATGNDYFKEAKVVVLSYDLLARKAEQMLQHNFGVVIFDESHMLKSYKSARYKAAAPLAKKMKRVILLSGTPALSRPMELYTQICSVDPSLFPQVQDYGIRYCEGRKETWGWSFRGSSNTEELQIIMNSCIWIRRLKSEVLSQLPPKQRMTVVLDPGLIKISKKNFEEMSRKLSTKTLVSFRDSDHMQFFVQTAEAKMLAVREYLKEVLESGRKFLVFAHHKVMIESLCTLCLETKTRFIRIDGKTSPEERMSNTTKFQTEDDVRVAVLSITAANTGITLTAAQLVIFAELYWNPGILVQAEDRAHRIGQNDSVMVQYLLAKKTADDHIWPLIQNKLEVLGKVGLLGDNLGNSKMSYQKSVAEPDIREFMQPENTSRETSPRKAAAAAATSDIRKFLQPENLSENADPNWNL